MVYAQGNAKLCKPNALTILNQSTSHLHFSLLFLPYLIVTTVTSGVPTYIFVEANEGTAWKRQITVGCK